MPGCAIRATLRSRTRQCSPTSKPKTPGSRTAWRPSRHLIDHLFTEMRARIKEADTSVPQKDGDYLYWIEFEEGAEYKKWWRQARRRRAG